MLFDDLHRLNAQLKEHQAAQDADAQLHQHDAAVTEIPNPSYHQNDIDEKKALISQIASGISILSSGLHQQDVGLAGSPTNRNNQSTHVEDEKMFDEYKDSLLRKVMLEQARSTKAGAHSLHAGVKRGH